jgi:hypothetical protein
LNILPALGSQRHQDVDDIETTRKPTNGSFPALRRPLAEMANGRLCVFIGLYVA